MRLFFETLGMVYLGLCALLIATFGAVWAWQETRWRWRNRKSRRPGYIREWPLG